MERMSAVAVPVVGMHRSGTSMVARMLEAGGVGFGPSNELAGPNEDNPYGFWEHEGIRRVNEELLAKLGGDWRNPPCITEEGWRAAVTEELDQRAVALLETVAVSAPAFGWKDPRTSLLLPFWLARCGTKVRPICCLRHPSSVAASLAKRN
ncbi:MAG: family 2 glycosyl transferase, partial [Planctomycetota bacterium]